MSSKYDLQNDLSLINVFKCNSDMQPRSAVALFLDQFWKSPGWLVQSALKAQSAFWGRGRGDKSYGSESWREAAVGV